MHGALLLTSWSSAKPAILGMELTSVSAAQPPVVKLGARW